MKKLKSSPERRESEYVGASFKERPEKGKEEMTFPGRPAQSCRTSAHAHCSLESYHRLEAQNGDICGPFTQLKSWHGAEGNCCFY